MNIAPQNTTTPSSCLQYFSLLLYISTIKKSEAWGCQTKGHGGYIGGCRTLLIIKTYTQDLSQQGAFAFTLLPTKTMIFDLCKRAQKQRISLLLSYPSQQYQVVILLSKIEKKVGVNLQSNKISLTLLGTFCLERYQGKEEEERKKERKRGLARDDFQFLYCRQHPLGKIEGVRSSTTT